MRPDEGRRARAAVQVLVAAADGEVGVGAVAGRPAPRRPSAPGPRPSSAPAACAARVTRGHVVHAAGAVVDVRQHQHARRRRSGAPADRVGVDQAQRRGRASRPRSRRCRGRSGSCCARRRSTRARRRVGALQRSAALSTLNRLTEVESATTDLARRGADQRARSCRRARCGRSIQPALFQLRIRPSPHSVGDHLLHARRGPAAAARRASCRRGRSRRRAA